MARLAAGTGVVEKVDPNEVHVLACAGLSGLLPVYPTHAELAAPPVTTKLVGFFKPIQCALCPCTELCIAPIRKNAISAAVIFVFFVYDVF